VGQGNVVPLHPLDDAQALAWLSEELGDRIETSVSDLARQFGWPRTRLRRRLATWVKAGHITRRPTRKGKFVIASAFEHPSREDGQTTARQSAARVIGRAFGADLAPIGANVALPIAKPRRSAVAVGAACVLFAVAFALTAVGLIMNARFAASFGQTVEAAVLLAAIGLAIDVLAVAMPTVAAQLWHGRSHSAAVIAWAIWLVALTMTLLAAVGFASSNIGDAVAGRPKIANESVALTGRIDRLRLERAGINEGRAVGAIEIDMQRTQSATQAVWKITDGCRDVTRPTSARACAPVLQLREAFATAQRRDAVDAALREAEGRLAALPAIVTADPQATTAAEIVTWLSAGHLRPEPRDIAWLRTIGLVMTPSLAGLLAMLALSLARVRRP
jgi:hypothetical protein